MRRSVSTPFIRSTLTSGSSGRPIHRSCRTATGRLPPWPRRWPPTCCLTTRRAWPGPRHSTPAPPASGVTIAELRRRAEAHGVATSYQDWRGQRVVVSEETLAAILAALGEPPDRAAQPGLAAPSAAARSAAARSAAGERAGV